MIDFFSEKQYSLLYTAQQDKFFNKSVNNVYIADIMIIDIRQRKHRCACIFEIYEKYMK